MPTIEQFTQEARASLNSLPAQTGQTAQLANKLSEACELLLDARLSNMSLGILKDGQKDITSIVNKHNKSERICRVLNMSLRIINHDIAKVERLGVYYGL